MFPVLCLLYPQNQLSFSLEGQWKPIVTGAGLPEHAPVFLMPHLDPLLPLVFVEFVLLQDPGKTMDSEYFKAQSPIGRG